MPRPHPPEFRRRAVELARLRASPVSPAVEAHIASLRADRETARAIGAADYVTVNMSAEIDAFTRVGEQMRRRLAKLDPDERADVEASSRILRRARAARRIPLSATTDTG